MKYAFLGAGNMAGAILQGLVKNGVAPDCLYAYAPSTTHTEPLRQQLGITICSDRQSLVADADILVLAVKPHILAELIDSLAAELETQYHLIISLAAGKDLAYLEEHLGKGRSIARVMPNINAKIGCSTTGCSVNAAVSAEEKTQIEQLFSCIGTVDFLPESQFGIFMALAGSAPAFAYLYIDALARAGQRAGMPNAQALAIAASAVRGSAEMILQSGEHPWALIDQVCSPGGTTIEGVAALEDAGFPSALRKAVDAVLEKDRRM